VRTTGDHDEAWYDEDAGPVARPYTLTRGRLTSDHGRLDLISLVVARRAAPASAQLFSEQARIIERCHRPLSVAEVAAELGLPLGSVRVLLGDLLAAGLIETHEPPTLSEVPSRALLEALLDGLRTL
jgi:DNA-directed RNA polymerase specialized sigma24 family protein